tara:strand:- start:1889 stop:2311 length:423 start_codon:yes stop_codon:yes gene_type:complete
MKECRKCSTELISGGNIPHYRYKNCDNVCLKCYRTHQNEYSRKKYQGRKNNSNPGVYGLYDKGELVYIGESKHCQNRWHTHLYVTSDGSKNDIGIDRSRRKDYEFKMLYEEDNLYQRLALEMEMVVKHKPKLNSPYKHLQ